MSDNQQRAADRTAALEQLWHTLLGLDNDGAVSILDATIRAAEDAAEARGRAEAVAKVEALADSGDRMHGFVRTDRLRALAAELTR